MALAEPDARAAADSEPIGRVKLTHTTGREPGPAVVHEWRGSDRKGAAAKAAPSLRGDLKTARLGGPAEKAQDLAMEHRGTHGCREGS